jgi:hypothetical protein
LLTLVVRGAKITHQAGDHDDYANAACGCLALMPKSMRGSDRFNHRAPRVVLGYAANKHAASPQEGWDGWFAGLPSDNRTWKPAPRVHRGYGVSYALDDTRRNYRSATAEELDTRKLEKLSVGGTGHFIQKHGELGGDGRQRYSVHAPDGSIGAFAWNEDAARRVALTIANGEQVSA